MYDNTNPEEYNQETENISGEIGSHSLRDAGLTGAIHVHKPMFLKAQRALLEKPYISSSDEAYFWIKAQYETLKRWHRLHTGWHIERRNDLFRLIRQSSMLTSGYRDSKEILRGARDFVYILWILWYAANDQIVKRGNGQLFLLMQMLERLSEEWRSTGFIDVLTLGGHADFASQPVVMSNRKSMVRALKYLQELQCLKELDGQIDIWVEQDAPVLYQFTNTIHLLIIALDPVALNAVTVHQKESTIFTPAAFSVQKKKQPALTRAWRALLIGPFFLKFDDPDAFVALAEHSSEIREELDSAFGWSLEVNHDYACIIRDGPSSRSASLLSPKNTGDQIVLLLCDELRRQVAAGTVHPDYYGCIPTTVSSLQDLLASIRSRFEAYWGKGVRDKGDKELLAETLGKMRRIGFIRGPDNKDTVLILPTVARYSPQYTETTEDISSPDNKRKEREKQGDFHQVDLWTDDENLTEN
jgi:uncharacterized protein (TIGR02678 family)